MSKRMGAAGFAAKESPLANYYRWEEPYSDITVCLNLDTVDCLQAEVLGGIGSFPDAGVEIGGILLGKRELEEGRTVTVVEDFEPVPCEHRHGPYYSLTAKDLVKLRTALARRRSGARRGLSVVGYYRSHNRDDLFLSTEDLAVIRTCFRDPDNIFLLIKALPGRACTAGFFFWNNGQIQSEFTGSEVALIPMATVPTRAVPAGDPGKLGELRAIRGLPSLEPDRSQAAGRGRRWALGGFALSAVAAATMFAILGYHKTGQAPRLESPRPALATDLTGSLPTVPAEPPTLNGTAQKSPAAIPEPRKIPVSQTDIQASDSQAGTSERQKAERPLVASPNDGQQNQPKAAPDSVALSPVLAGPGATPSTSPASAHAPPDAASTNTTVGTKVAPSAIVEAPPVAEPVAEKVPLLTHDQQRPAAAPPVAPAVPAPLAQTGTNYQPVETRFVGPQIIHQVAPAIPLGVGPKITTDVQIDVTVTIDESGKVIGARVTSRSGAAAGLLTLQALKAAQLFRFRPAQENNRHVRSDMVLTFRFAPKTL
jgi:TonB family protein